MKTKVCNKCGEIKPSTDFSKGKSECKLCSSARFCEWYSREKEKNKYKEIDYSDLPPTKICSICKKEKPITDYYIRRDRNKLISRCSSCNHEMSMRIYKNKTPEERRLINRNRADWYMEQAKKGNIKAIIQHKLSSYRNNAKRKNVPFEMTSRYLIDLFNKQNGKCYYSGVNMDTTSMLGTGRITLKNRPHQMSLDRLDPSKGYVEGNVVWCTYLINTCKNMFTENEFYDVCEMVILHRKCR